MDAHAAPISRVAWLKSLAAVALMGAFFLAFALAAGPRPSVAPEETSPPGDLRELRARLGAAVERLHGPDAGIRGEAVRDVVRIARDQIPPALGGEAGAALAEQASELAALAREPATAAGPFARKAQRLLGFVDACIEMRSGEPAVR